MTTKTEYQPGQKIGSLIFQCEITPRIRRRNNGLTTKHRKAMFLCNGCGQDFPAEIQKAIAGKVLTCSRCYERANNATN
jgi:hypothetical protein